MGLTTQTPYSINGDYSLSFLKFQRIEYSPEVNIMKLHYGVFIDGQKGSVFGKGPIVTITLTLDDNDPKKPDVLIDLFTVKDKQELTLFAEDLFLEIAADEEFTKIEKEIVIVDGKEVLVSKNTYCWEFPVTIAASILTIWE